MRHLEPGCLAMVIRDENIGMVVACTQYCPPGFRYRDSRLGKVRETLVPAWLTDDSDGDRSIRAAASLMRIDGGDELIEQSDDLEATA